MKTRILAMLRQIITGMLMRWKKHQLTSLILSSLFLQIALLILGKLRKYNGKPFLRFAVWSAYSLADWVPTVALGVISSKVSNYPNKNAPLEQDLISFWAPFLLLHLGGPDTITAYSLEDNQLWQRRLLELVVQLAVTIYIVLMALPDWSVYWLKKHYENNIISKLMAPRRCWTNSISQYSIRKFCRKEKSVISPRIIKLFVPENKVDEIWHLDYTILSGKLKEMIFNHFLNISKCGNKSHLTTLCSSRGKEWLEKNSCSDLIWSISEVEFDQSILLWHIATDLCYFTEDVENDSSDRTESRHMSEYMLYLLVMCPSMLPMGIGMIRFRDTCAEAWEFFKERRLDVTEASKMLLRVNTEIQPGKVKGDRSKSVLFDACRIATELRSKYSQQKWSIISGVWVEILAYAACHCRGTEHAKQLRKGGEFLTHVWLLMAHLGITEQFQISQGHARAKLSAK